MREDVYFVLTSLAHVVATVLFGMLLNLQQFPGLLLIAFAVTSKTFALFAGENERFFIHLRWAAIPLAVVSVIILAFLPPIDWLLGGSILLLYLNYPRLLKAREKSPLDVLFHGGRYGLLFWLGYGSAFAAAAVAGVLVVFISGVAGELLVGLRSEGKWKTSASRLGVTSAVRVVNILVFVLFILGSFIFAEVVNFPLMVGGVGIPVPILAGIVIAVFITRPVRFGKSRFAPLSVRRREIIVIAVVAVLIVGLPLLGRADLSKQAPSENYSASVDMQTLVTGAHPQEGQWIIFNYQNSSSYYYVLLHTDGNLEVSGYVGGVKVPHIAFVQTNLSPFNSHRFGILVENGLATISIDGHQYATVHVAGGGGEVRVTQAFPKITFWVVVVSSFEVSPVSS